MLGRRGSLCLLQEFLGKPFLIRLRVLVIQQIYRKKTLLVMIKYSNLCLNLVVMKIGQSQGIAKMSEKCTI